MPNLNGTGPLGQGKMSGRGLGPCCGEAGAGTRRDFGGGRGRGRGRCMARAIAQTASLSSEEQAKILNERLKEIEEEKKSIESKLDELK